MKKVYIFGCSFSSGSYDPLPLSSDPWVAPDCLIPQSKGWYHFVDYLKDKDVTVISCPGQGYWSWYQLLLKMDAENQLNFDEIWIQETLEPRVAILDLKKIELNWYPDKEVDDIKVYMMKEPQALFLNKPHKNKSNQKSNLRTDFLNKEMKKYIGQSEFYKNLTSNIAQNIQELCAKKNISGYVWSMFAPTMKCKEFKRLSNKLYPLLSDQNLLVRRTLKTNGSHYLRPKGSRQGNHATEEGNKYIGKLMNEVII